MAFLALRALHRALIVTAFSLIVQYTFAREGDGFGIDVDMMGDTLAITSFDGVFIYERSPGGWVFSDHINPYPESSTISSRVYAEGDLKHMVISGFANYEALYYTYEDGAFHLNATIKPHQHRKIAFGQDIALGKEALFVTSALSEPDDYDSGGMIHVYNLPLVDSEASQILERGSYVYIIHGLQVDGDVVVEMTWNELNMYKKEFSCKEESEWNQLYKGSLRGQLGSPQATAIKANLVAVSYLRDITDFLQLPGFVEIYGVGDDDGRPTDLLQTIKDPKGHFNLNGWFGWDVALSETTLVVGAKNCIHVFEYEIKRNKGQFVHKHTFNNPDPDQGNLPMFGQIVSVSEDTIVAGDYLAGGGGKVSVYQKRDGVWAFSKILTSDNRDATDGEVASLT